MILSDIKAYLAARGQATLADIARHFDADPDAVRGMLDHWIRKGRITKQRIEDVCGLHCGGCEAAAVEIYVWLGSKPRVERGHRPPGCSDG